MRIRRFLAFPLALGVLAVGATAQAATITVGSPLEGSFTSYPTGPAATFVNSELRSGSVVSPITGAIIGWNVIGASGPFSISVLTPLGSEYIGGLRSAPGTPLGTGREHFATELPIRAGQTVGLTPGDESDEAGIGGVAGSHFVFLEPPPGEGQTAPSHPGFLNGAEVGFNAEVRDAPSITLLDTNSGPAAGGTTVTITGASLEDAREVTFGGNRAPLLVDSPNQVVATAPPGSAGTVPVRVTTVAGTATAPQGFTYIAPTTPAPAPPTVGPSAPAPVPTCKVPKLAGRKLRGVRKVLFRGDCKLGHLGKVDGVTAKAGKVIAQSPKPGTVRPAGSKVSVKLG